MHIYVRVLKELKERKKKKSHIHTTISGPNTEHTKHTKKKRTYIKFAWWIQQQKKYKKLVEEECV